MKYLNWNYIKHKYWDIKYYLKCFFFKRYNVLKIQTLPVTFTDATEALPHAMFQILTDFVDKEKAFECGIDWYHDQEHIDAKKTILDLYDWWHNTYLKFDPMEGWDKIKWTPIDQRFEAIQENPKIYRMKDPTPEEKAFYDKVHLREQNMEVQLNMNLHRLIDIRKWMWT